MKPAWASVLEKLPECRRAFLERPQLRALAFIRNSLSDLLELLKRVPNCRIIAEGHAPGGCVCLVVEHESFQAIGLAAKADAALCPGSLSEEEMSALFKNVEDWLPARTEVGCMKIERLCRNAG